VAKLALHDAESSPEKPAGEDPVRKKIIAEARRNFFTHGIRGVTMDDLAGELGMSKKTLYAHFPSKTALVKSMIVEKLREVESELEEMTSECSTDFPGVLQRILALLQRHTGEIKAPFLRDILREAPETFKLVETRRRELLQRFFGKILGEGRRAGTIREDIPAELIMEILLSAVQGIMNPAKMEQLELTPRTGLPAIISVILEGIITEKGRSKP
jgi:TetR/AcrR family transcriptional regulator, cholesterol catabolism regulator